MAITLGLVEAVDDNGVYVTMPGSRGVLRGPYRTVGDVSVGDSVLIAATDDGEQVVVGAADSVAVPSGLQPIVAKTGASYTASREHIGYLVTLSHSSLITVTLPEDDAEDIPIGGRIDFVVIGAGMAIFAADSGSTVNGTPSLTTRAQYSAASAIKRAADTWLVLGDMA